MDFLSEYQFYHKYRFDCNILKTAEIRDIRVGSGGSPNIVFILKDKDNNILAVKLIPNHTYPNFKIKPDKDQLEIKFYQFFTKKYLLTKRTPHIVGIFNHQFCKDLKKVLISLLDLIDYHCPTIEDSLKGALYPSNKIRHICDLLEMYNAGIYESTYDIVLLEYCPLSYADMIVFHLGNAANEPNNKIKKDWILQLIHNLDRTLFQIIFTLAIIKDDYPGFLHADLFCRNIRIKMTNEFKPTDFVAYHYGDKVFYLSANGAYAKISDFSESILMNEIVSSDYEAIKSIIKYRRMDPYDKKTDIFNLLHDIYDGENEDTISIIAEMKILNLSKSIMNPLLKFFSKFIDTTTINEINKKAKSTLDNQRFGIDRIKLLSATVQTPKEYLLGNTFDNLTEPLPPNSTIVMHYNKSKK